MKYPAIFAPDEEAGGFVVTLAAAMRKQGDLTQALTDTAELRMLTNRGSATDVAAGILYPVSDASRFVSGSELVIDAGYGGR